MITTVSIELGAVTSSAARLLVTKSWAAVISLVPAQTPVASPEASIVAAAAELAQVALDVRSAVLLSLKVPVAVNCCVAPSWMEALTGVTEMDWRTGGGPMGAVRLRR